VFRDLWVARTVGNSLRFIFLDSSGSYGYYVMLLVIWKIYVVTLQNFDTFLSLSRYVISERLHTLTYPDCLTQMYIRISVLNEIQHMIILLSQRLILLMRLLRGHSPFTSRKNGSLFSSLIWISSNWLTHLSLRLNLICERTLAYFVYSGSISLGVGGNFFKCTELQVILLSKIPSKLNANFSSRIAWVRFCVKGPFINDVQCLGGRGADVLWHFQTKEEYFMKILFK